MEGENDLQELYKGLLNLGPIFGNTLTTWTDEKPNELGKRLHDGMLGLESLGLATRDGSDGAAVYWTVKQAQPQAQSAPSGDVPESLQDRL